MLQSRRLRLIQWLSQKQPEWCRQRSSWALYLFPPENRLAFFSPLIISFFKRCSRSPCFSTHKLEKLEETSCDFLFIPNALCILQVAWCGTFFSQPRGCGFPWHPHPPPPTSSSSSWSSLGTELPFVLQGVPSIRSFHPSLHPVKGDTPGAWPWWRRWLQPAASESAYSSQTCKCHVRPSVSAASVWMS